MISVAFVFLQTVLQHTTSCTIFPGTKGMIEEVDYPCRTFLPFDMLQRKDKVNTFGIKEDVRDVLLFAGILEV